MDNMTVTRLSGGGIAIAVVLAAIGCGLNARETDLQKAVKARDVPAVRRLLAEGASLGPSLENEDSPYEIALVSLSASDPAALEVFRVLLTRMDADVKSGEGVVGIRSGIPTRPANMFFTNDRQGSMQSDGLSAVEIAARQWSVEAVELLIEHGLDIRSEYVADAVVAAAGNGAVPVLVALLDAGAEVDRPARSGDTALGAARRVRGAAVTAFLLGRGARAGDAPKGVAQKAVESALGAMFAPEGGYDPHPVPAGEIWLERADVLRHAAGRAAVSHGVPAGNIDAGSVLLVRGTAAELHVAALGEAPAGGARRVSGTTRHTLTLDGGTWTLDGDTPGH